MGAVHSGENSYRGWLSQNSKADAPRLALGEEADMAGNNRRAIADLLPNA